MRRNEVSWLLVIRFFWKIWKKKQFMKWLYLFDFSLFFLVCHNFIRKMRSIPFKRRCNPGDGSHVSAVPILLLILMHNQICAKRHRNTNCQQIKNNRLSTRCGRGAGGTSVRGDSYQSYFTRLWWWHRCTTSIPTRIIIITCNVLIP